jgi:hypothetical protein
LSKEEVITVAYVVRTFYQKKKTSLLHLVLELFLLKEEVIIGVWLFKLFVKRRRHHCCLYC